MINLFAKISHRLKTNPDDFNSEISDSHRVYCIGDIHGCCDLLKKLHQLIIDDAKNYQGEITLIYVGDYIDRGDQSKQVIDYLLSNPLADFKNVFLMGNHEQVLMQFLLDSDNPKIAGSWFNFGGLSTLASYGVNIIGIPHAGQLPDLHQQLSEKMPDAHWQFFQNLQSFYQQDDYYFVHAGIRPGVKLAQQQLEDMLWIRDKFLDNQRFHGKTIVHGHTISETPVIRPNRIGIDTGAYSSGILSCLVLETDQQRFLST